MTRPVLRRLVLALSLLCAPALQAGDLNAEIDSMFSSLGAMGNYTEPGAFRSQAMNTYSGGSLMMRVPQKRYQLFSYELPKFAASCGGLSATGGSFSMISGDELKEALKQITASLPGVAFQVALEVVSPILASKSEWFKNLDFLKSMNGKSSCEMANALVGGIAKAANFRTDAACQSLAMKIPGAADDNADAQRICSTGKKSVLDQAAASPDPTVRNEVPFHGNVVWEALKRVPTLDDDERELIMSVSGTLIYKEGEAGPTPVTASIPDVKTLVWGDTGTPGGTPGMVKITMLRCGNRVTCENPEERPYDMYSFNGRVRNIMMRITEKLISRESFGTSSAEVNFVNMTTEPVYKMLSVATLNNDPSAAQSLIGLYGDVIAADYAYNFLARTLGAAIEVLADSPRLDVDQARAVRDLRRALYSKLQLIAMERNTLYAKMQGVHSVTERVVQLERTMRNNSPSQILDLLARSANYY